MDLPDGGGRDLFINFGEFEMNGDFRDDLGNLVECPFPSDLRTEQDGTLNTGVCSALVTGSLFIRSAFDDDGEVRLLDMDLEDPFKNVRPDGGAGI